MNLWPWRYGRLRFQVGRACDDVEVLAQTAPTRWGPWGKPSPEHEALLQEVAEPYVREVQRYAHYGGQAEALLQIHPRRRNIRA